MAAHNADISLRPTRPPLAAPLRLKTGEHGNVQPGLDSLASAGQDALHTGDRLSASPKTERLPSFRHISKMADAAGDDPSRSTQYPPPPQSVYPPPSIANQSPVLPHQPYPQAPQISPASNFGFSHQTSPSSVQSEVYYPNSPPSTTYSSHSGYNPRRQSFPMHAGPVPPPLNPVPTGSSSGESYGHHSSLGDSSTSHTTPIDSAGLIEHSGRGKYSMIPGMHSGGSGGQGPWYCDHPGCNASPFPTQYLLK